jgi:hypothetical protein
VSRKRILLGFSIIIGVAVVLVAIKLTSLAFNRPAQGTISTTNGTEQPAQAGIDLRPEPISGTYVSFSYPRGLTRTADSKLIGPVVAMYNFSHHDVESWNLAIEILVIPSGQLADNNSYQLRKINPNTYQESHITVNNQLIDIMTDKTAGGFSKVAFLVHGQYQATVSLYGDDANGLGDLQSTFTMVLGTWHWLAS